MNILIIATNQNRQPVAVMPLGACIVAEAAKRAGHTVRVLDLMFKKNPRQVLEKEFNRFSPDVVGLAIRNIDNNDIKTPIAFYKNLRLLTDTIRKLTKAPMVLGGSAVGIMPEEFLRYTAASVAVLGEGEIVFPNLLAALSRNECFDEIPGIAWLENNIFKKNPLSRTELNDTCLTPDFNRWIDVHTYLTNLSTVPIQTKRGCPFECIYCTYSISEGRDYRLAKPESVVRTIQNLVGCGMSDIEFVDNVFNSPYEHALAICEQIGAAKLPARLQSIELNPLFVDDRLLTAMEKANFVGIGVTAESASDPVLGQLRKGFTSEDVRRTAQCIRRHRLPCFWIFMLGGPGETESTVRETLAFAENFIRPQDTAFFNIGVRIYPGTELERLARAKGELILSPQEMFNPIFYFSPLLNPGWLTETFQKITARNSNFIGSDAFTLPFLPLIYRWGYRLGLRQPLWKHTRFLRRSLRILGASV